jgi:hypothetical protein
VAKDGVDPARIQPYNIAEVNPGKYASLKVFKKPFGATHVYLSYFLMFLGLIHVTAVVRAELSGSHGLVSAIFSGRKRITGEPEDDSA